MSSIILNSDQVLRLSLGSLFSFLISLGLTPLLMKLALALNCVAAPKQDRWHSKPTPLLGGVSIFVAFMIPYLGFFGGEAIFWPLLIGGFCAVCLGLADDLLRIKPSSKLIGQILIACITIGFGFRFVFGTFPFIGIPLTILWIVGMMNAMNLLDNMDGLAGGIAAISALFIGINSLLNTYPSVAVLMALLVGASLGFLRYNFTPAKIFMGDSGSMLLGYLLSIGAILQAEHSVSSLMMMLALPVLILSVPIFDTTFVTLARKLNRRPISQGGRDHSSHRLVAFGLSEKKAVLTLYAMSGLFGTLSLLYSQLNPAIMWVLIGLVALILFSFGMFLGEIKVYTDERKLKENGERKGWIFLDGIILYKRRIVEVLVDLSVICLSYFSAFLLRFEGFISHENLMVILDSLPILIGIKLISFFSFGLYRGVWRYVSLNDLVAIFKAVAVGEVGSVIYLVYFFRFEGYSRAVFIIDGLLLLFMVAGSRVILRLFREFFISLREQGKRILIMGAGDAGELALREVRNNRRLNYKLIGFIDDDKKKKGYLIHGIPVLGTRKDLIPIAKREGVEEVLIAIPSVSDKQLADVYENCQRNNILCHRMPYVINIENSDGNDTNGGQDD